MTIRFGLLTCAGLSLLASAHYGARATMQESSPKGLILYLAAPILVDQRIWGVATVYKPQRDVEEFLADTERTLTLVGFSVVIVCTVIGGLLSRWVTAPLAQLTRHAIAISEGERPAPLRLPGQHLRVLGESLEQMRERQGKTLMVRISDEGPGIPAYALNKIFDRFYSLARPSTGKRSSGLGLCFAREVAHLHHGSVMVQNRRDSQGAEAVLTLAAAEQLR